MRITRLQGYTPDVDTLGTLVWARTPAGVWWPGEALDPHHMPPTRAVPPLASAGEDRLSLPASALQTSIGNVNPCSFGLTGSHTLSPSCVPILWLELKASRTEADAGVRCLQR